MKLTRGGITLVALVLFVLAISPSSSPTIFIVLACFLAAIILNAPYALLALRRIAVQRDHPSHVREGTEIRVNLHVTNMSKTARILLRFLDAGPGASQREHVQIPLLEGGDRQTVSYSCRAARRGIYTFTSCRAESSSPFGLVNARRSIPAMSELVVYPIYYELIGAAFPFRKTHTGLTAAPGARPGEGLNFFGVREYRHGDPIRKIHWPSTVRTRRVMVKEFEEDLHSSVAIILDTWKRSVTQTGPDTNLEVAIRAAASLANYMLVNGHPASLTYFDVAADCTRTDKATGDLTPLLDGFARAALSGMKPWELLDACERSASKDSNWIVVLLSADQETFGRLLRIRSRGVEIVAVVVDKYGAGPRQADDSWLPAMLGMFERAGINVIMLAPGDDVQASLSKNLAGPRRVLL